MNAFVKILIAVATVTLLSLGSANAKGRPHRASQHVLPHIIQQKQAGDVRYIYIHNPLSHAIWAFFECEEHLTTTPVGIGREHVAEVKLQGISPDEHCVLNHYRLQVKGHSPETWIPANDYTREVSQ